ASAGSPAASGRLPWPCCPGGSVRALVCSSLKSSSLLGFLVARMAVEGPGRRELAELVTHHFLVDGYRHMLLAVVDAEHQADELRQDGRAAAPDLDHVVTAGRARGICLLEQREIGRASCRERG